VSPQLVLGILTVLRQQVFEVVEIEALVVLGLLRKGNEEAYKEDGDDEDEETERPLDGAANALAGRLLAVLGGILVVFLIPEVGERDDEQAEDGIERVERVVYNAQGVDDAVDLVWRSPVLLAAQAGSGRGRDEGNVDGNEQDGGQQGKCGEDADNGDGGSAIARLLIDVDKGGRDEEEDAYGDGVGDPDEAGLDESHDGCLLGTE
jgi:hypothetical protein